MSGIALQDEGEYSDIPVSTTMEPHDSTKAAIDRLRDLEPQATQELFSRYAHRLTLFAEAHLSQRLAGRLDAEDVVQSVFRTFFRRVSRGEFEIDDRNKLWRLLVKITLLKARAQGRYHTASIRAVAKEVSSDHYDSLLSAVGGEPSPLDAAILTDEIESLLRNLPEMYADVLRMRMAGCTTREIAAKTGVSRQTVSRAVSLLRQRLDQSIGDSQAGIATDPPNSM